MKEIRAGLIGCGTIHKNHMKALQNVEGVSCAAVCDLIEEKARATAAEYHVGKIYTDYRQMLQDPDIDTIHICTPHFLHAQMAMEALQAGKHVLCEKPMALSVTDAEQMSRTAAEADRILAICFQNRYNEASVFMKKILDAKKLGRLLGARGQVVWYRKPDYYTKSDWKGRWKTEGGGVLINQAIHTFDLLQWLAGPVTSVKASISTKNLQDYIEVEDTVDVLMTGEDNQRLLFYASNCYVKNAPVELEFVGEKGTMKMVGNMVTVEVDGEKTQKDFTSGTVLGKDYWGSGHGLLINDFYRCIRTGDKFPVGPEEAITSVKLLDAVYTAAKTDKAVHLQ